LFLGNETRANSGFVSYVSFFLCFDFDPNLYVFKLAYTELFPVTKIIPPEPAIFVPCERDTLAHHTENLVGRFCLVWTKGIS
jgi:hypothetical protein